MVTPRNARQPTFFWQGLLILLPVGVLAVVGMISLRQDKILAEHDARERAQAIADGFLQKFSAELNSKGAPPNAAFSFAVDQAGDLAFPPAWNPLPIPRPLDPAVLNAEQARWWATLQAAETGAPDGEADDRAFKAFMDSNPPENFAAAAAYDQGLRLTQQGRLPEAVEAFALVTEKYPTATGESGLPLAPLAQLKLFEIQPQPQGPRYRVRHRVGARVNLLQPDGADTNLLSISLRHFVSLDMLCSNIVYHPTPLSSYLLNCVRGDQKSEKWLRRWQDHETARQMYAVARGHFVSRNQPVSEGFALMSISGNDQQDAEAEGAAAKVSFPRQFWFTTPNPLFLPKAQALGNGTGHSNYQGWSLVVGTNAPGTSNAVSTVTYWMGGGILDRNWLAITAGDAGSNRWYVCRGESELGLRIKELAEDEKRIPAYFGIGVEVAGRKIKEFAPDLHLWTYRYVGGGKSSGREVREPLNTLTTNVLASAAQAEQLLKVNVYLTSPDKLYQLQRARTFWFGALVAASAVAALIGLLAAWRVFRQQHQLNELKSNFVSSVSHELRAPIAAVRLMAENLEGGKIPESNKQKEYFGFILQECRRLSALIENVLDFSRIEQGRKQYEFEPTDVLALVQTTVKLMEPVAAEKGVRLGLKPDDPQLSTLNSQPIEMDGRAIQQALVNLMDNAIKHSPPGEAVTVELELRNAECRMGNEKACTPGHSLSSSLHSRLVLSVSDHGPGIPPEEHAKIFERFYRRGSELRRETQGVGIGLSIVKHIVEAHGGRVLVQSETGRGSRFVIELPVSHHDE